MSPTHPRLWVLLLPTPADLDTATIRHTANGFMYCNIPAPQLQEGVRWVGLGWLGRLGVRGLVWLGGVPGGEDAVVAVAPADAQAARSVGAPCERVD